MTVKAFPVEHLNAMVAAWYGEAYAAELLAEIAGGDHALVTAAPINRPPDRPGGFGIDPDAQTVQWEWDVDFDASEDQAWSDAIAAVRGSLEPDRYSAIRADVAYLRAKTRDAGAPEFERRTARVLLAMLRDD